MYKAKRESPSSQYASIKSSCYLLCERINLEATATYCMQHKNSKSKLHFQRWGMFLILEEIWEKRQ